MDNYMLEEQFRNELGNGEYIIWAGQPVPKIFNRSDIFLIPFSIVWSGFAVFWEIMAFFAFRQTTTGMGIIFPIFGLPFVLIGLYLLFGRFIYRSLKNKRTFYALTNQRVMVLHTLFGKNLRTQLLNQIPALNKSVNSNGIGSITFGDTPLVYSSMFENSSIRPYGNRYRYGNTMGFFNIKDVDDVYRMINDQRKPS